MKRYKDFIIEASARVKKAEKALDDAMNSAEGKNLASALNDGAEDKAVKILKKLKIKGTLLDDVLDIMFGEL